MAIANYTRNCAKHSPGNNTLWVSAASNVTSVTVVGGEITLATFTSSFLTVDVDIDTLQRTQEGTGLSGGGISYDHKVIASFSEASKALNVFVDSIADASPCGLIALVKDANGLWWMVGYSEEETNERGLYLQTSSYDSGLTPADEADMEQLTLGRVTGYRDLPVASTANVAVSGIT